MFWVLLLKSDIGAKVAPTPAPCRKGGRRYSAPKRVKGFWRLPLCWRASQLYLIRNCNWGRGSECAAGFLLLLLLGAPPPSLDRTYQTSRLKRYCILQIVFYCLSVQRLQYIPLSLESSGQQHTETTIWFLNLLKVAGNKVPIYQPCLSEFFEFFPKKKTAKAMQYQSF